jgi:hypothetical protein
MPLEIKPSNKDYPTKPRKAAPSAEIGDDGANRMNDRIQKQKMDDLSDRAVGRIKTFQNIPGYTIIDAMPSTRRKKRARKRNDPVST